jgi:uncharacterized beta-barrel protein YwiB (DUF1934 family)
MKLRPGEAAVLIVRRSETELSNHFVAVRQSESSFDIGLKDFQLHNAQKSLFEIPVGMKPETALEEAISILHSIEL